MGCNKEEETYNPLRKDATPKTATINHTIYKTMNWQKIDRERDFIEKGMIADAGLIVISGEDSSSPVWDLEKYAFLESDQIPCTVNPKLWVQGTLNLHAGLFRVTDNIYQIRGFDLANMTLIRGCTGWIVIDCLSTEESAEAALNFAAAYFGDLQVSALIVTHSHVDHYGGILGVIEHFAHSDTKVYVPEGFVDHVIEENVTAGIAMSRRGIYQFGSILPRDAKGEIDVGIGKGAARGTVTFTENVVEITSLYERRKIDGVDLEFLLALDTEAPAEMFVYVPCEKSLCIAEDANATMHNLYTLRGAKVRDAIAWADSLQNALCLWGDMLTTVFGVHTWPRFGNACAVDYLEKQRDIYQYINDQTLRRINQGYTIEDVGRMVELPDSLADEWYNNQFYGTVNHNAKGVYQRYLGWYNSNPVDLNKLLPQDSAKKYVEYMGGEARVMEKACEDFAKGEYQWVAEVTKQVIYANPHHRKAKLLCADALEQLGYIAESGVWRNEYLTGAEELRYGVPSPGETIISEDVLNNLPLGKIMYLLSIRMDGVKAGDFDYKINFVILDREEAASTEIKRGIFRYLCDEPTEKAVVTVIMPKKAFYQLVTTNERPDRSEIRVEGDVRKWYAFLSLIDDINPDFAIVTPIPRPIV